MAQKIATQWLGVYCYDQDFHLPDLYAETKFEMILVLGWFGRFKGTILDAEPGIPELASIRGRLNGAGIAFSKQYASLWIPDKSRQLAVISGQKSYVVYYVGEMVEGGTRITGTWHIPSERRWIDGVPWDFPTCTGTWTATSLRK